MKPTSSRCSVSRYSPSFAFSACSGLQRRRGAPVAHLATVRVQAVQPGSAGGAEHKASPGQSADFNKGSPESSGRSKRQGRRGRSAAPLLYLPSSPSATQVQWLPSDTQPSTELSGQQTLSPEERQQNWHWQQQQWEWQHEQQEQWQHFQWQAPQPGRSNAAPSDKARGSILQSGVTLHRVSFDAPGAPPAADTGAPKRRRRRKGRDEGSHVIWPGPDVQTGGGAGRQGPAAPPAAALVLSDGVRRGRAGQPPPLQQQLAAAAAAAPGSARTVRRERGRPGQEKSRQGAQRQGPRPGPEDELPEDEAAAASSERQLISHVQELARLRSQLQQQQQQQQQSSSDDIEQAGIVGPEGRAEEVAPGRPGEAAVSRFSAAVAQGERAEALLLRMYKPLVLSMARRVARELGGPASEEEVLLEAQAALLDAARRFEPGRGADRLGPLAQLMIKNRVRSLRKEYTAGTGLNSWLSLELLSKLRETQKQLADDGRAATPEALAEEMGLSVQRVEGLLELAQQQLLQLDDTPANEEARGLFPRQGGFTMMLDDVTGEALAAQAQGISQVTLESSMEEPLKEEDPIKEVLEPLLRELEPRLAYALRLRLGLAGAEAAAAAEAAAGGAQQLSAGAPQAGRGGALGGMTEREVAARLGVSRQRAHELIVRGMGKLRERLDAAAGVSHEVRALVDRTDGRGRGRGREVAAADFGAAA